MSTLLEMRNICKFFTGVKANEDVNLVVEKGEVHALLGENGAASTLMNVPWPLCPHLRRDFAERETADISSPKRAIEMGIGMVHQHFMLIPRSAWWKM